MQKCVVAQMNLSTQFHNRITLNELILNSLNDQNDWIYISCEYDIEDSALEYFCNNIKWPIYVKYHQLEMWQLEKYVNKYISWYRVCKYQHLTLEFIQKHYSDLNWIGISKNHYIQNNKDKFEFLFK